MTDSILALFLIAGGALMLGFLAGWSLRAVRAERQKLALNAEWQEQFAAVRKAEQRVNRQRKELSAEVARLRQNRLVAEFTADLPAPPGGEDGADADAADATEAAASQELEDLRRQLADSKRKRESLRLDLERFVARSREFTEASRQKDEKIFALSRELESWQQRLPPLVQRFREREHEHTNVLDALELERQRNQELSETLNTRVLPDSFSDVADIDIADDAANSAEASGYCDGDRDDLKRIRGVGPKLERTLNALGIYRLHQIAAFDESDIERVGSELGRFPGRIRRDRWVEQARRLSR
ncbi:MAG: hypothetical protein AAFX58_01455 [Pseudomonadota bacterium]